MVRAPGVILLWSTAGELAEINISSYLDVIAGNDMGDLVVQQNLQK